MNDFDAQFLVAPCPVCDREVLAAGDIDADGAVVSVCVHCSARLQPESGHHVDADDLEDLGYVLEGRHDPHAERGCRDGGCGVRQPDPAG